MPDKDNAAPAGESGAGERAGSIEAPFCPGRRMFATQPQYTRKGYFPFIAPSVRFGPAVRILVERSNGMQRTACRSPLTAPLRQLIGQDRRATVFQSFASSN